MTLSLPELRRVVAELRDALDGALIQQVRQPDPSVLLLELRAPGHSHVLLACIEPRRARVHLTERRFKAPARPFAFVMKLRKELAGGRVSAVRHIHSDRVVAIDVRRGERHPQGPGTLTLLLELSGHHPNAFLLDDQGVILLAQQVTRSTRRSLDPGDPYEPPLPHAVPFEERDRFADRTEVSVAIDTTYEALEHEEERQAALRALRKALRAAAVRERRKSTKIGGDLKRAEGSGLLKRQAELLKTHAHSVPRGARSTRVVDWYDPEMAEVEIPLDPTRSAREHVERLFHDARRLERAAEAVRRRLEASDARADALTELSERADADLGPEELARLAKQARTLGVRLPAEPRAEAERPRPKGRLPYRELTAIDGSPILVGRSARDNDSLTFRIARADDFWLHARGRTGAHVILRVQRGAQPDPEALADAAQLAALFSEGGATDSGVEVAATPRRYVRKPKGLPPGAATFSKARTLLVTPDPVRLERLRRTESTPTA